MSQKKTKLTNAQFELFKKECVKWIRIFGLINWEIRFFFDYEEDTSYAWTIYNHDNRVADIHLTNNWEKLNVLPNEYEIKRSAFHEVVEVLLFPLRNIAESRYVLSGDAIDCEVHDIVRTLENVVFMKGNGRRLA